MKLTNLTPGREYNVSFPNQTEGSLRLLSAAGEVLQEILNAPYALTFTAAEEVADIRYNSAISLAGGVPVTFDISIVAYIPVANAGDPVVLNNLTVGEQYTIGGTSRVEGDLFLEDLDGSTIQKDSGAFPSITFTAASTSVQVRINASLDAYYNLQPVIVAVEQTTGVTALTMETANVVTLDDNVGTTDTLTMEQRKKFFKATGLNPSTLYGVLVSSPDSSGGFNVYAGDVLIATEESYNFTTPAIYDSITVAAYGYTHDFNLTAHLDNTQDVTVEIYTDGSQPIKGSTDNPHLLPVGQALSAEEGAINQSLSTRAFIITGLEVGKTYKVTSSHTGNIPLELWDAAYTEKFYTGAVNTEFTFTAEQPLTRMFLRSTNAYDATTPISCNVTEV